MNLERFESFGWNCEFGFVLQKKGLPYSSLLRWSITPYPALIRGIGNDFAGVYEFERLIPSQVDMVQDTKTGFHFHTKMVENHEFVENYKSLYPAEEEKSVYLRERLLRQIADPKTIFVYKSRTPLAGAELKALAQALSAKGPANLLYVSDDADQPLGSVRHVEDNLYQARIDVFSHPAKARDASYDVWDKILENADSQIPVA